MEERDSENTKKKKKKITWKVIKAGKNGVNPERLSTAHQKVVHML